MLVVNAAVDVTATAMLLHEGVERDEQLGHFESVYSITWSARCRSDGGIVRPRALAVFKLMVR